MNASKKSGSMDTRRAVAEWLEFLKDIGVREMKGSLPGAAGGRKQKAADPGSEPASRSAPAPTRRAPKVASGAPELFAIHAEDSPRADPAESLRRIREEIGDCTRCRLCEGRTHIVFGVGDPKARLMFVGEGPGAEEDAQGEPFVGRAGQKLNEMIRAIGLRREEVYIANVVKCRPPGNRAPEPDEIATCSRFLFAQIEAIRPQVIVALGGPAAQTLLGTRAGITQLRGHWGSFRGIPVMPTFHPAYLLRAYTRDNRAKVWSDLKAARAKLVEGA